MSNSNHEQAPELHQLFDSQGRAHMGYRRAAAMCFGVMDRMNRSDSIQIRHFTGSLRNTNPGTPGWLRG